MLPSNCVCTNGITHNKSLRKTAYNCWRRLARGAYYIPFNKAGEMLKNTKKRNQEPTKAISQFWMALLLILFFGWQEMGSEGTAVVTARLHGLCEGVSFFSVVVVL